MKTGESYGFIHKILSTVFDFSELGKEPAGFVLLLIYLFQYVMMIICNDVCGGDIVLAGVKPVYNMQ